MLMTDKDFYYRADDEKCKSCGGAVKQGNSVLFSVKISRRFYAYNIYIVFCGAINQRLKLKWNDFDKGFDTYSTFFDAKNIGLCYYHFEIDIFGRLYTAGRGQGLLSLIDVKQEFSLTVYEDFTVPEWFKGSVMYHIFVDRFYRGKDTPKKPYAVMHKKWKGLPDYLPDKNGNFNKDFFGGNLSGIIEKLGYLKSLGVGCVYLSPVFEAYSNHKYDTGDYGKIDSMFGSEEDFKELIGKAKELDIKIIIDGVFNHTGSDSIYFNKKGSYDGFGAYQSKDSKYYNWYDFKHYPDDYESWWGIKTLPAIKKDSTEFHEFIAGENGILKKWLNMGVGGIRIDVADELSNSFLKKINNCCKSISDDILIIGEVWEDASDKSAYGELKEYFWGRELSSVMNYPLKYAITDYILLGNSDNLSELLKTMWENYPRKVCHSLMNVISSHDTGRILTILSGVKIPVDKSAAAKLKIPKNEREKAVKRLKMAVLLQYTVYGVPSVYYGDEAGMEGAVDPFNRKPFPWGNIDEEIFNWYKYLGDLRRESGVFYDGGFKELYCGGGVYIFERYKGSESVIIACNNSQSSFTFEIILNSDLITGNKCDIINLNKGEFKIIKN